MKRIFFILSLTTLLAACAAPAATAVPKPAETVIFVTAAPTEPVSASTEAVPNPKLPAPPFEAQTYIDDRVVFALDYPSGWTVTPLMISERATQVQFLSSSDISDLATVPPGETRLTATLYKWDPKNDLTAYVANWKTSWESSGFKILEEEKLVLEQGLPAVQLTVQLPETTVVYLITAIGDQYLVLSGEGDLELVKEIVQRVRPISR